MSELPAAFFLSDGDHYRATALCRGPWDPGSLHGGPVTALIGREVERSDPDPELCTVRLTVELLRPVPLADLHLATTVLRPGKRVRILGVSVTHDGTEVARATALRIRRVAADVAEFLPVEGVPFAPPDDATEAPRLVEGYVGIMDGMDVRTVGGVATRRGPATYWFRMRAPLVDDEPVDPVSTALMAADFGNGISSVVPIETHLFINPDLTVYLHRPPEGEWVANEARTWLHPGVASVAEATLWDRTGQIGQATQSLYVASR
jgi:hypothetical protein